MQFEVLLINDVLWEQMNREFHIFEPIERCSQIKILDVHSHEFCILCAEDAIQNYFGCGEVCCASGELARIFDEVASRRHADAVWIFFLGAEVNDDARVSHDTISGNIFDFFVAQDKD